MKKPTKHVVNLGVTAIARETGFSPSTVSKKLREGKTPDEIRAEAARNQNRRGPKPKPKPETKRNGPGTPPSTTEYDIIIERSSRLNAMEEAKLRRQKALAERQEIENMLRRGELLPISYARLWGTKFLIAGRDEMLKGPSELADSLAAETDPVKIQAILGQWIDRIMAKFEQLDMLWKGNLDNEQVA